MVDVKIDHRDARQAVRIERMHRANGDIVENAKAHRRHGLGVMARRPHRAERHLVVTRHHRIDSRRQRASSAPTGFARPWRDKGVWIELNEIVRRFRERAFDRFNITRRMHALDRLARRKRRLATIKIHVSNAVEHGLQSARMLSVPTRRFVLEHRRMGEKEHAAKLARRRHFANVSPR